MKKTKIIQKISVAILVMIGLVGAMTEPVAAGVNSHQASSVRVYIFVDRAIPIVGNVRATGRITALADSHQTRVRIQTRAVGSAMTGTAANNGWSSPFTWETFSRPTRNVQYIGTRRNTDRRATQVRAQGERRTSSTANWTGTWTGMEFR